MGTRYVLFDFDGTLADTFVLVMTLMNKYAGLFRYSAVPEAEFPRLRGLDSRSLIGSFGISALQLPFVAWAVKRDLRAHVADLKSFEGMGPALTSLAGEADLAIVSSNSAENIAAFLRHNGFGEIFKNIHTARSVFGKHKPIRQFVKSLGAGADVIYVGDETRDIDAAVKAGVRTVAVSWGYATRDTLASRRPDAIVDSPSELALAVAELWRTR
jgi:phosphoglycolate phosphatase